MWEALERLLSGKFMPHGHCYLWTPAMVWLQVLTNLLIALAYVAISLTIYYILRRIRDIPFSWMYFAFGVFIITCGATHFLDVVTIWSPIYWFDGGVRAITAMASVGTAVMLVPLVPKAIALADTAKLAHDRGVKLESTYDELVLAHQRTKEAEELKTRFFANVSHELRTPLTLILGPLERLKASPRLDDSERQMASTAWHNAHTLLFHVNDLLDVTKLEAKQLEIAYAKVDVAALVRRVAEQFGTLAAQRGMRFEVDAAGRVEAEVDAPKLERVIVNLLGNAFKFTPDGGAVRCSLAVDDGALRLAVADDGPGVPERERRRIFERFTQVDPSMTRVHGGTGLGLAIVAEIVGLHHGRISVDQAPEGGALFEVVLPSRAPEGATIADAPPEPSGRLIERAAEGPPRRARAEAPAGAPRVLVVEDNREMNAFVAEVLGGEYAVTSVFDGEEGLAAAAASPPDLVVTDLMMPRMSGEQLVTALRGRPALEDVPVLLLSAAAESAVRTDLLRRGAQDYLLKPFSPDELCARVANLVATKRARETLRGELASRTQDLASLATEVTKKARDLEAALAALEVSHELRTPLAAAQLVVERLVVAPEEELGGGARRNVARLERSIRRLTELVDDLLTSARIQSGKLVVSPEDFDVRALVNAALDDVRSHAEAKSLRLAARLPEGKIPARTDQGLLRLALANLLSNAVKFTREGAVGVSAFRDGEMLVIQVEDTGIGISEAEQSMVFEPFRQLESIARKHVPGVGLGLSLVRDIAAMLGGGVELRSTPGAGSVFELRVRAAT
jgi:signal transduction histidine kinase